MSIKYTDLELFSKKHIINPYRNKINVSLEWCGHSHDCDCGDNYDFSLDEVVQLIKLHQDSEWFKLVKNRLSKIDYYFPSYIQHELLELIR